MKQIMIPCGHCNGKGVIPLPDHLEHVLMCLGVGGETTPDIVAALEYHFEEVVTIPALCNRLKVLEELGLASKEKTIAPSGGCWYLWSIKEKP